MATTKKKIICLLLLLSVLIPPLPASAEITNEMQVYSETSTLAQIKEDMERYKDDSGKLILLYLEYLFLVQDSVYLYPTQEDKNREARSIITMMETHKSSNPSFSLNLDIFLKDSQDAYDKKVENAFIKTNWWFELATTCKQLIPFFKFGDSDQAVIDNKEYWESVSRQAEGLGISNFKTNLDEQLNGYLSRTPKEEATIEDIITVYMGTLMAQCYQVYLAIQTDYIPCYSQLEAEKGDVFKKKPAPGTRITSDMLVIANPKLDEKNIVFHDESVACDKNCFSYLDVTYDNIDDVSRIFAGAKENTQQLVEDLADIISFLNKSFEAQSKAKQLGLISLEEKFIVNENSGKVSFVFEGNNIERNLSIPKAESAIAMYSYYLDSLGMSYSTKLRSPKSPTSAPIENKGALGNFLIQDTDTSEFYLSDNILIGQALSSLYKPLDTNLYNNPYMSIPGDPEFLKFHSKYGNLRKGLIIETSNTSVSKYINTGKYKEFRHATMRDLLENTTDDKLLLLDQNFYNKSLIEYPSDKENEDFESWRGDNFSYENQKKNFTTKFYKDDDLNELVEEKTALTDMTPNPYVGLGNTISMVKEDLITEMFNDYGASPVFMSSDRGTTKKGDSYYINYLLLENIKNDSAIRYTSALDMDSPIFMDIYGNIVSESGVVIIPFSANATLHTRANLMNVAFLTSYGSTRYIEYMKEKPFIGKQQIDLKKNILSDVSQYMPASQRTEETNILIPVEELKRYIINPVLVAYDNVTFNIASLSRSDQATMELLYKVNRQFYDRKEFSHATHNPINLEAYIVNILYQVPRGSQIEYINYTDEGFITEDKYSPFTLSQTSKFEEFRSNLMSEATNGLLALPTSLLSEDFGYIIYFALKILMLLIIVCFMCQIYYSGIKSKFSYSSLFRLFLNMITFVLLCFLVPVVFNATYYTVNKYALQDEALLASALNEEKDNNGIELCASGAQNASSNTDILIKIDSVDVPWVDLFRNYLISSEVTTLDSIFKENASRNPLMQYDCFELKGKDIYISADELFSSSEIVTDFRSNMMKQVVRADNPSSFYMPYYVILDYLVYNVNSFNALTDSYNYAKFVYGDGRSRSMGLVEQYFKSDAFLITSKDLSNPNFVLPENLNSATSQMASYDKVGIYQMYDVQYYDSRNIFSDKTAFPTSAWYKDGQSEADLYKIVNKMDEKAVSFVLRNQELLGRVSDETFLKMMALHLSLEYNSVMHNNCPTALEIYEMSSEDIVRMATSNREDVMINSPLSYSMFILDTAGLAGVYIAALLELVLLISAYVKPISTILIMLALFASLFIYKMIMNRDSENMKGFLKFTAILVILNIGYSILIKITTLFPTLGVPSLVSLILQTILHASYIYMYIYLCVIVIKNWRDLGNSKFDLMVDNIKALNLKVDLSALKRRKKRSSTAGIEMYNRLKEGDRSRHM